MSAWYPDVHWVELYHQRICEKDGTSPALIDRGKLEGALSRPMASAFGEDAFPTIAEKAAALVQGIAIAHAFLDGNKRAAFGTMLSFLEANGVDITVAEPDPLYDFVIAVTTGELREIAEIAARLATLFRLPT